ncbi:MAG: hypothetical protein PHW04_06910 [Candidatus Wallbacteria bacterium]|nr:hypothetical protein [Candidatus Wallbacteria bacterium]
MKSGLLNLSRNEIVDMLAEKSRTGCVCVAGLSGSGKTWLANALAAEIQKRGRNALQIDCRRAWTTSDVYSALSESLLQLTCDNSVQAFSSDPGKFLGFISRKNITLIIDNFHFAENPETIALLEEAASGRNGIVVFSRERPKMDLATKGEVFTCVLPGLTEHETGVMFDSLFEVQGQETPGYEAKQAVFRLTQGHPFSIRVICALLGRGNLTLSDLKKGENETLLGNYLEWPAWNAQSDDFRHVLKLISIMRTQVDREIIRDIAGADAAIVLEKLRISCLSEIDLYGRISLPLILKNFIRGKIPETELLELHKKTAVLLLCRFGFEPAYLEEIFYHFSSAGEWHAAIDALTGFGEENLFLQGTCSGLIPLIRSGAWEDNYKKKELKLVLIDQLILMERFQEAQEEIEGIGGFYGKFFAAGIEYFKWNNESALTQYSKLLSQTRDQKQRFLVLNRIALCHIFIGNFEKGREFLIELSKMQEFAANPLAAIRFYISSTKFSEYCGKYDDQLTAIEKTLDLMEENGIKTGLGIILYVKSYCLAMLGRNEESARVAGETLKIAEKHGDTVLLALAYDLHALLTRYGSDWRKSIEYRLKCIELCRCSNNTVHIASHQVEIGTAYLRLGEIETAEHYFQLVLETIDSIEDIALKIIAINSYCELLIATGRFREALEQLQSVEKQFQGKCPPLCTSFNFLMGTSLEKLGEAEKAGHYFSLHRMDLDSIPSETRKLFEKEDAWLIAKLQEPKKIRILRRDTAPGYISTEEVDSIRSQAGTFEFFADFMGSYVIVDGRNIEIFKKRVMARMLQELVSIPGTEFSAEQLYPKLWNRKFEPESDAGTFRAAVSRLRKTLDPDHSLRFILSTKDSSDCCFNPAVNYCILLP